MTAPIDASCHDPGDEDQAERKPANWWLYQQLAQGRSEPRCCSMCGSQLDAPGGFERSREVAGQYDTLVVCGAERCDRTLDAVFAAMSRRTWPAEIRAAFRRGIEAAQAMEAAGAP